MFLSHTDVNTLICHFKITKYKNMINSSSIFLYRNIHKNYTKGSRMVDSYCNRYLKLQKIYFNDICSIPTPTPSAKNTMKF